MINITPVQSGREKRLPPSYAHLEQLAPARAMRIAVLLVTLVVAVLYITLLAWYIPLDGLWAGDQGVKLVQVQSLLRSKFRDPALPYPGATIDPAGAFSPLPTMFSWFANGRTYSIFSYAYASLTAIPYALLGYTGLYVIPVIATLATCVTASAIARRLAVRQAWLVPLVVGLTTPLGFYALVFWEHALAVCITTLAVFCTLRAIEGDRPAWALAGGLLVGLAYWMRSEILWLAPALFVGLAWAAGQRRLLYACACGLIAGITPLLLFNTLMFGLPLGAHLAANYAAPDQSILARLLAIRMPVLGRLLLDVPERAWLSVPVALFALLAALPLPRIRPWLLIAMAAAIFWGIYNTQPIDLRTGLVSACPLVLLAVLVRTQSDAQRPVLRLLVVTTLVYSAGVLVTAPNDGGYAWGPRYLLPVIPLLAVLSISAATTLLRARDTLERWACACALALLLIASALIQHRGTYLLHQSARQIQRITQSVDAQKQQIILTDIWYAPQLLGPLYLDRVMFWITRPEQLAALRSALQQHHISSLSYVTGQRWWHDEQTLNQAGLACSSVEKLPMSLELLDCHAVQ